MLDVPGARQRDGQAPEVAPVVGAQAQLVDHHGDGVEPALDQVQRDVLAAERGADPLRVRLERVVAVSSPTMIPAWSRMPYGLMIRTASSSGRRRFCVLSMARRASSSGVSMPKKRSMKLASRIIARTSRSCARFSVHSPLKRSLYP